MIFQKFRFGQNKAEESTTVNYEELKPVCKVEYGIRGASNLLNQTVLNAGCYWSVVNYKQMAELLNWTSLLVNNK